MKAEVFPEDDYFTDAAINALDKHLASEVASMTDEEIKQLFGEEAAAHPDFKKYIEAAIKKNGVAAVRANVELLKAEFEYIASM